ncbi:MAG: coiled-coil domain-containing protein [Bacteroidales bacterium]|jgi:peptidoglycan hydrolase CwlO-like protein
MKKLFLLMLIPAMLMTVSCNNMKEENARLKAKNDSLLALGFQKDTTVMEFVRAFNDIQSNLDSIKLKENIISQNTNGGTEVQTNAREQITGDINAIYLMLQKNRDMVASLRAKLKKSESGLAGANIKIAELEKMIDNLTMSIETKDAEISQLKDQLGKLNIKVQDLGNQVTNLNTNVENLSAENKAKQQAIEEKTAALNTAYYVVGTTKELKEKKIIDKSGGFIGIGRSKTVTEDFDKTYFTKADITNLNEISIFKKKAVLLTNHPAGSYKFEGADKKSVDKLVILDYTEFWSRSKYLVIIAD